MTRESYNYPPLPGPDSIRLLTIHPGRQHNDTLQASLQSFLLGSSPSYDALSYVWGDPDSHRTLVVGSHGERLDITENLYRALASLRTNRPGKHLWVDAICIDQENLNERSSQVQLMSKIYKSAQNIIAWLGDGNSFPEKVDIELKLKPEPIWSHDIRLGGRNLKPLESAPTPKSSVTSLLQSSWWSRVWVVQEVMFSRNILFHLDDGGVMTWDSFWHKVSNDIEFAKTGFPKEAHQALYLYNVVSTTPLMRSFRHNPVAAQTLSKLGMTPLLTAEISSILRFCKTLTASDPRDKIFSIYGIIEAFGVGTPKPDYSKSAATVYQDAIIALGTGFGLTKENSGYGIFQGAKNDKVWGPSNSLWENSRGIATELRGEVLDLTNTVHRRDSEFKADADTCRLRTFALGNGSPSNTDELDEDETDILSVDSPVYEQSLQTVFANLLEWNKQRLRKQVLNLILDSGTDQTNRCNESPSSSDPNSERYDVPNREQLKSANNSGTAESRKRPTFIGIGRKRIIDEEEDDEDEQPTLKKVKDLDPQQRFACPFYQRDSRGPRLRGSCHSLGFPTIARLKEHLYRTHHIYPCDRCGNILEQRSELSEHLRALPGCVVIEWRAGFNPAEGFDDQQAEMIRRRNVRTWNQIFKILFPDDPESGYPPQFYCDSQLVRLLDDFNEFYATELQRRLPRTPLPPTILVLDETGHEAGPEALAGFITTLHNEIISSFRNESLRAATAGVHLVNRAVPGPETGEFEDPSAAFLSYILDVAPDGALDSLGDGDGRWSNNVSETPGLSSLARIPERPGPLGQSLRTSGSLVSDGAGTGGESEVAMVASHNLYHSVGGISAEEWDLVGTGLEQ